MPAAGPSGTARSVVVGFSMAGAAVRRRTETAGWSVRRGRVESCAERLVDESGKALLLRSAESRCHGEDIADADAKLRRQWRARRQAVDGQLPGVAARIAESVHGGSIAAAPAGSSGSRPGSVDHRLHTVRVLPRGLKTGRVGSYSRLNRSRTASIRARNSSGTINPRSISVWAVTTTDRVCTGKSW